MGVLNIFPLVNPIVSKIWEDLRWSGYGMVDFNSAAASLAGTAGVLWLHLPICSL